MPDNFQFGGGAAASSMTPVVLALMLLSVIAVVFLPRKYSIAPVLVAVFLTPFGQQLLVGGFHFYVPRILALAAAIRLLTTRFFTKKSPITGGINSFDKIFIAWAIVRAIAGTILTPERGVIINQVALTLDALGGYLLIRFAVQDGEDILRAFKVFAGIISVLAACMFFEYFTRINVFSYLAGSTIVPWIRNGHVRSQGTAGNSITAGAIGATLLPLFYWLWKSGKTKFLGMLGIASASIVAITSMASTPITGWLAGIGALCLWPIRRHMKTVRWSIVFTVLALALVMKAPVWYIVTKVNVAGGDSWDRANLLDQTVKHFFDWWLVGTNDNANWGDFTWDQCNQFAAEALQGGLGTLVLFVMTISRGFGRIGQCRKLVEGEIQEWFYWCLGSALFAHIIVFLGVDYFDQTRELWFIFLAIISAATAALLGGKTAEQSAAASVPLTVRPLANSLSRSLRSPQKEYALKSGRQSRP